MAGEGQMLRAARKEKEWSYMETEETTKIRVRYIQALEEEDYKVLPGTTYVRGYLRTYAKLLGLDPDEIISLYNDSIMPETEPVLELPQKVKGRPLWVRSLIIGCMAVLTIVLIIAMAIWYQPEKKIADSSYSPPALPSAPQEEVVTPVPTSPVVVPKQEAVVPVAQEGLTAKFVFTQPCWIEVRVDGKPSFQGEYKAGTTKDVKGTSKIELVSVGNAGGLSVNLNGKDLPSLGKAGAVLRNVVLTKENLK